MLQRPGYGLKPTNKCSIQNINLAKAFIYSFCYKLLLAMAKTNDYGGHGLNRGYSMHLRKPMPEGVAYSKNANKWLVRILKKGKICTMKGFDNKEDADMYYAVLCEG